VTVERAQARDLALERGGRGSRPLVVSGRELGHERRQVDAGRRERVDGAPRQEVAELLQIGAVGLQRVARQPTLQLEVGEEVERQFGDAASRSTDLGGGHEALFRVQ